MKTAIISACLIAIGYADHALRFKWIYVSSSAIFNQWQSSGLTWKSSDKFPESMYSLNAGAQVLLPYRFLFFLGITGYYSRVESFRHAEEIWVKNGETFRLYGYQTIQRPLIQEGGLGDVKLSIARFIFPFIHEISLSIPSGYQPKRRIFQNSSGDLPQVGFRFTRPWSGFGVYRMGYYLSLRGKMQYISLAPSVVIYKPSGKNKGMVEQGDYSLEISYGAGLPLNKKWSLKPMINTDYINYHWEGPGAGPRWDFSLKPGMAIAFTPHWSREIKISISATAYGVSNDKGEKIDSPRKIAFGVYYGIYR